MSIRWDAVGASDIGRVRRGNEDAFVVDIPRGIFLVADGMGGHAAGEVASALATEVVGRELAWAVESGIAAVEFPDALGAAFQRAWEEIVRCCRDDPRKEGMGTTLTACVLTPGGTCWVGHIGDSRAYRLRDTRIDLVTHDHTWVQREVDAGRLELAAAETHPFAHILTRVLSADLPPEPDLLTLEVHSGDVLLLTTDGLHGLVGEAEMLDAAESAPSLVTFVDVLIQSANRRGGRDNITAAAIRILPG